MATIPRRGHEALRRGRWSSPSAEYFLTCCTEKGTVDLGLNQVSEAILSVAEKMASEHVWSVRTAVVMRDHVHLLVVLGKAAELAVAMRLFKGRTAPALRTIGTRWQRGYYDHRVRGGEDRLPIFLYIFMNPYRARFLQADQKWIGYFCAKEDWAWFAAMTNEECAFPEWLM